MPIKDTATFSTLNGLNGPGRPTKRTKKVIAELTDAISAGAPFGLACQAAGIHYDTFGDWRRRDPAFALQVDQAAARGAVNRLKKIEVQGEEGAWAALAWMVERRYPAEFSKPEIQIGLQTNINAGANGANVHSLESIVVSDLEFLKLRELESYEHRPRQAREAEAEIVPVDLSGALAVQGHPGAAVISETQAEATQRRVQEVNSKIDALIKSRHNGGPAIPEPGAGQNGGHNGAPSATPAAQMKLPPIVMPAGEPSESWWAQLVTGDNSRQIAKEAAIAAVRRVLCELLGPGRARGISIEFQSEPVTLSDLYSACETLTGGSSGWQTLLKLAGRH